MKRRNKPVEEVPDAPDGGSKHLRLLAEIALLGWVLGLISYFYYKSEFFFLLRDIWNLIAS
jgi:hypothetical protein